MSEHDRKTPPELSRRRLLAAAGLGTAAAIAGAGEARASVSAQSAPAKALAPPVAGLHLQFGADASSEVTVSWHTLEPVSNARVLLGRL